MTHLITKQKCILSFKFVSPAKIIVLHRDSNSIFHKICLKWDDCFCNPNQIIICC